MESNNIIVLSDIYELRALKQKELDYYNEKLKELQTKLFFIRKEIEVTNIIIDAIEKEKIHIIGKSEE